MQSWRGLGWGPTRRLSLGAPSRGHPCRSRAAAEQDVAGVPASPGRSGGLSAASLRQALGRLVPGTHCLLGRRACGTSAGREVCGEGPLACFKRWLSRPSSLSRCSTGTPSSALSPSRRLPPAPPSHTHIALSPEGRFHCDRGSRLALVSQC